MLLSCAIVDFHLLYDGSVNMRIWALLTRSHGSVSDTQLTVKAYGFHMCFYGFFSMSGYNQVNGK